MICYWNSVKENDGNLGVGWKHSGQHESLQQKTCRSATKQEKPGWDMHSFNILHIFMQTSFSYGSKKMHCFP